MRVLLIARHFPPVVSGGARRGAAFYSGLRSQGAQVTVLSPVLAEDVDGIAVDHPQPVPADSHEPALFRDWAREALLLPDPDIRWAQRATRAALEWGAQHGAPDWVITTSPPESIHACGEALKRHWKCGWAADFRDHWLVAPLRQNRQHRVRAWRERRWARRTLATADLIIGVNPGIQEEMRNLLPDSHHLLMPQTAEAPSGQHAFDSNVRNLVHTGSFSLSEMSRKITPLLDTFHAARQRNPDLRLTLIGRLSREEKGEVGRHPDREAIVFPGVLDADASARYQAGADLCILVAAPGTRAIPGKLFEYAAAGAPVAFIGGDEWSADFGWDGRDPIKVLAGELEGITLPPPPDSRQIGECLMQEFTALTQR